MIIGAGPAGLKMSKLLLDGYRDISVDLVDQNAKIGGSVTHLIPPSKNVIKGIIRNFDCLFGDKRFNFHHNMKMDDNKNMAK